MCYKVVDVVICEAGFHKDGFVCCNWVYEFTLDRVLLAKPWRHDLKKSKVSFSDNPGDHRDETTSALKEWRGETV